MVHIQARTYKCSTNEKNQQAQIKLRSRTSAQLLLLAFVIKCEDDHMTVFLYQNSFNPHKWS